MNLVLYYRRCPVCWQALGVVRTGKRAGELAVHFSRPSKTPCPGASTKFVDAPVLDTPRGTQEVNT